MTKTKIALVGVGKIARDQHIPALQTSASFELAAAVSHHAIDIDVPLYNSISELALARTDIRAVSICTPPVGRVEMVREAFRAGLDVMIEKPPCRSIVEAGELNLLGQQPNRVLFASWHSREAPGVQPAREWLRGKTILRMDVEWKEDVRVWHPQQDWIWDAGIGVFDPGINALSVLTEILPAPFQLKKALLKFPVNRAAPIAADLDYLYPGDAEVHVEFDFDQQGTQTWNITIDTDGGCLLLSEGASRLSIDGQIVTVGSKGEYPSLYSKFAGLLDERRSQVDLRPFFHVAEALHSGSRDEVEPFSW